MYIIFVYIMCFVTVLLLIFLFIAFRDAVTESFPGVTHLMYYFHVVKNCKEKLRCSVSAQECNALMTRLIPKWTEVVPNFLTYFLHQWMVSDSFGSWKVYCSEPSKAVL